ncbi:hypothetical protein GCM10010483_14610 [Actinokineospora diospyrosa]
MDMLNTPKGMGGMVVVSRAAQVGKPNNARYGDTVTPSPKAAPGDPGFSKTLSVDHRSGWRVNESWFAR